MSIVNKSNISKTIHYLKKNGIVETGYATLERLKLKRNDAYKYVPVDDETLKKQRNISLNCDLREWLSTGKETNDGTTVNNPRITVVIPAYETPESFLREAVESVLNQSFPTWELVIADASEDDRVLNVISGYKNVVECNDEDFEDTKKEFLEGHIIYTRLKQNLGISENTNAALKYAAGDYIALLDHDDVYTLDALFEIACAICKEKINAGDPGPAIIYSDEDKTDSCTENFYDPHQKYDFNYDYLLTNNYICHLVCIRRDIFNTVSFRKEYDGAQDYDLMLQIAEYLIRNKINLAENFLHVPKVLYHWRCHEASTASNSSSKMYAYEAGLKALQKHVDNLYNEPCKSEKPGISMIVSHSKHLGFYKITYGIKNVAENEPKKNKIKPVNYTQLFGLRPDIGAVICRHCDKMGRMLPIIWNENGELLYNGINKHFSGELNRFDCAQNVAVADIRYICINPKIAERYVEILGKADNYKRENNKNGDIWFELSEELAKKLREDGLKILYLPEE